MASRLVNSMRRRHSWNCPMPTEKKTGQRKTQTGVVMEMGFVVSSNGLERLDWSTWSSPTRIRSSRAYRTWMASRMHRIGESLDQIRKWERMTRPGTWEELDKNRFDQLPKRAKQDSQMLGRMSNGCEGTCGVFPKCNFACRPCYHSKDANRVRVDGTHTLVEVARQMEMFQEQRGDYGFCQLIGGEVSLLAAEDHAKALEVMRSAGRVPMSFTHGDFDYEYLRAVAVDDRGRPRFSRIDFAAHFDSFMFGRRGVEKPSSESDLHPFRERFVAMFERLRHEHGVNFYLAHNMTIQAGNLDQIPETVRRVKGMNFRMLSFQPAALQGDPSRWTESNREVAQGDGDLVWRKIEEGVGCRLPYSVFQMGDERCNRTCFGAFVGRSDDEDCPFVPFFLDNSDPDLRFRDKLINDFGNIVMPPEFLAIKIFRFLLTDISGMLQAACWFLRFIQRAGGIVRLVHFGARPVTFVMHRFMDASLVNTAWNLINQGLDASAPEVTAHGAEIIETVERLSSCSYGMANSELGKIVPACVQHAVYDPLQNKYLADALPLSSTEV